MFFRDNECNEMSIYPFILAQWIGEEEGSKLFIGEPFFYVITSNFSPMDWEAAVNSWHIHLSSVGMASNYNRYSKLA
jgi:hypothetical protein